MVTEIRVLVECGHVGTFRADDGYVIHEGNGCFHVSFSGGYPSDIFEREEVLAVVYEAAK